MQREAKKYLWDMRRAGQLVAQFTAGRDFDAYLADIMLRSAVERQFEIIGEALARSRSSILRSPHGSRSTRASSVSGTS
jgi:uncharacterized protein with HEPN domain